MGKVESPIGFFDSGVGGISVLKEAVKLMPSEDYIYFGDSKNAPYGTKTVNEVRDLTFKAVDFLLKKNVKAIVIACNTATSAAINYLRETIHDVPVIGIEPALKPAVELNRKGRIVIMATPMTLSEKKFENLMEHFKESADIYPLPCPGLAELIESGNIGGEELKVYLETLLSDVKSSAIAAVVLGCTHYPFAREELSRIIGAEVPIIDGSMGTVKYLKNKLKDLNLLKSSSDRGKVEIYNSIQKEEVINLSYKLLNL